MIYYCKMCLDMYQSVGCLILSLSKVLISKASYDDDNDAKKVIQLLRDSSDEDARHVLKPPE